MRKKQKRFHEVIQSIAFLTLLVSASAMDSENVTIPTVAMIIAIVVLFTSFLLEERRDNGQLR